MTQEEILEIISHQIMFLVIAGAQRFANGSPVYDEKMILFATDALNHLCEEVEAAFQRKNT